MAEAHFPHRQPFGVRLDRIARYLSDAPGSAVAWKTILVLALADLALTAGHIFGGLAAWTGLVAEMPPVLSIFGDDSVAERVNHVKWVCVCLAMAVLFWRTRVAAFLALSVVFVLVVADDALLLHERGATVLLRVWPDFPSVIVSQHQAAELAIWVLLGFVVVPVLLLGLLRTPRSWYRAVSYMLVGFAAALVAGIGLDTIQEPLRRLVPGALQAPVLVTLQILECTAESLAASLTAGFSAGLLVAFGRKPLV